MAGGGRTKGVGRGGWSGASVGSGAFVAVGEKGIGVRVSRFGEKVHISASSASRAWIS